LRHASGPEAAWNFPGECVTHASFHINQKEGTTMRQRFAALLRETFELAGQDLANDIEQQEETASAEIILDGQRFVAVHSAPRLERFTVYCDVGPLPEDAAPAVLRRLLEANLSLAEAGRAGFGLLAQTNDVLYAVNMGIALTTPSALLTALKQIAEHADEWRESQYLPDPQSGLATLPPWRLQV
jgi:hypothetical protein